MGLNDLQDYNLILQPIDIVYKSIKAIIFYILSSIPSLVDHCTYVNKEIKCAIIKVYEPCLIFFIILQPDIKIVSCSLKSQNRYIDKERTWCYLSWFPISWIALVLGNHKIMLIMQMVFQIPFKLVKLRPTVPKLQ